MSGAMKCLGVLGGMSWESTQGYYRLINEGVKQRLGGLHSARLVLYSVDFAEIEALQAQGAVWDVLQLQAARSKPILHMHRMAAENPVWIVCAQRGEGSAMPAASAVQTAQGEAA